MGGAITFPTPAKENPILVTVSPSTSSHTCIVLPGEGLPSSSLVGDLVLKTSIRVPLKLSWRQARIWRRFANLEVKEGEQLGMVEGIESDLAHRWRNFFFFIFLHHFCQLHQLFWWVFFPGAQSNAWYIKLSHL